MISRHKVIQTLQFEGSAVIPRHLWTLPWAEQHHASMLAELRSQFPDDLVTAPLITRRPLNTQGDMYAVGNYVDEWGCRFVNIHEGILGQVKEPLIREWHQLEDFSPPEQTLTVDTETIDAFCRQSSCFVLAASSIRPFERLGFIRSLEKLLVDLIVQPSELFDLIGMVHRHYLKEIDVWCRTDVDAIVLSDDWGSQYSLLIAPDLWRRLFKPLYRAYADSVRSRKKFLFMHSDGNILSILPDLIEIGIHAINCQVGCMGIDMLSSEFAGKITFWGEIDRQRLLPTGTPAEIDETVQHMFRSLHRDGGLIAQCEFGPGARPENVRQVFQSFHRLSHQLSGATPA